MNPTVDIDKPSFGALRGKNTYFHMPLSKLELWKPVFADIAAALEWGTRASVVIPGKGEAESAFTSLGFKVVHTSFFEDGARLTNQCWFRHSLPLTRESSIRFAGRAAHDAYGVAACCRTFQLPFDVASA